MKQSHVWGRCELAGCFLALPHLAPLKAMHLPFLILQQAHPPELVKQLRMMKLPLKLPLKLRPELPLQLPLRLPPRLPLKLPAPRLQRHLLPLMLPSRTAHECPPAWHVGGHPASVRASDAFATPCNLLGACVCVRLPHRPAPHLLLRGPLQHHLQHLVLVGKTLLQQPAVLAREPRNQMPHHHHLPPRRCWRGLPLAHHEHPSEHPALWKTVRCQHQTGSQRRSPCAASRNKL
mmetsp:Transcript_47980/g.121802  ORF Transcript_47980/g.121802 Transcript_47980/m.121802 type:complete len:234 (+) Transcript_47980:334-1035(+)